MDSKAMADNFLEALQNGTTQPAAQDASAAGFAPALKHCVLNITASSPAEHDILYRELLVTGLISAHMSYFEESV